MKRTPNKFFHISFHNFLCMHVSNSDINISILASGASPAMIHSIHEIPDFTPKADALYINIGTLSADWVPAMQTGAKAAVEVNRPWVLDPVAVSASSYRMDACLELIAQGPTVIRGNASEILALSAACRISSAKVRGYIIQNWHIVLVHLGWYNFYTKLK
jgi:hydroxyethylthiazole kinase-like sugar kinase family protein